MDARAQRLAELFKAACERADRERFLEDHRQTDPELYTELLGLLDQHDRLDDFMETPALHEAAASFTGPDTGRGGETIGNYEVVSFIGGGGMGDVYLARHRELGRQVALKIIRRGMDSEDIVRRFRREERVLAALNHPNIAHLYGGGVTDDGVPFFAMEYVVGRRIDEYCDEQQLTIRERLKLFRKVCGAINYAHQHLVVHRDIKPSNILVTAEAEPKLLDFGIGKLLDPTNEIAALATLTIAPVLTPEYASPEHIRGEPISTVSDIYSLGVLLYELLTGSRPYRIKTRRPDEIARVITETEPAPPSSAANKLDAEFRRSLKGDLDNIVLMAMRKEPQRRYASAAQFSEDIRRYLENLPVRARKETFSYLASKFILRHRVGVSAAVLICLSLTAGVVFSLYEARQAQRRFNDIRDLAHSLIFEIHDAVQDLQGSTPTRRLIVTRALEYLDRLNASASADASLQREVATGYEKIGDIQGNPYTANLGDAEAALASYRKATGIRERLSQSGSSNEKIELARSYRGIGDIMELKGNLAERLSNYRHSLAILQEVAAANPDNVTAQDELARAYETLGDGLSRTNDEAATAAAYTASLQTRSRLLANFPQDPKQKRSAALALLKVASVAGGSKKEAIANMHRAISILEELAAADPQNARARREVGFAYYQLGMILATASDHGAALPARQKALEIREEIALKDPQNQQAQFDLGVGHGDMAESLTALHAFTDAMPHARQSIEILTSLAASDPRNAIYARNLALAQERLAACFEAAATESAAEIKRISNLQEARACYQQAHDIFVSLRDNGVLLPMDSDQITKFGTKLAAIDQQLAQLKR